MTMDFRNLTQTRHTFSVGVQRQPHFDSVETLIHPKSPRLCHPGTHNLIMRRPRMVVGPRHYRQMTVEGGEKDAIWKADHLLGIQRLCTTVDQLYTRRVLRRHKTPIGIDGEESSRTRAISEVPQQQQRWRETPGLVSQPDGGKGTEKQATKTPVDLTPSRALSASRTTSIRD